MENKHEILSVALAALKWLWLGVSLKNDERLFKSESDLSFMNRSSCYKLCRAGGSDEHGSQTT